MMHPRKWLELCSHPDKPSILERGGSVEKERKAATGEVPVRRLFAAPPGSPSAPSGGAEFTAHTYDNTRMKRGHLLRDLFPPRQWFRRE